MVSDEDELVNSIIKQYRKKWREWRRDHDSFWGDNCTTHVEVIYNHYGTQGAADLYISQPDVQGGNKRKDIGRNSVSGTILSTDHVYEIKSDAAIRNSTGANQIIRQFNKMRSTFFDGSRHAPSGPITYHLTFHPSCITLKHLSSNAMMYKSMVESSPSEKEEEICSQIELWHPDNNRPIQVTSTSNIRNNEGFMGKSHNYFNKSFIDENLPHLKQISVEYQKSRYPF